MPALLDVEELNDLGFLHLGKRRQIIKGAAFALFVHVPVEARKSVELEHRSGDPEQVIPAVGAGQIKVDRRRIVDGWRHL